MDTVIAAPIEPDWTLVFCKNPGPWWVRLLAWGRYNHVKAIAYVPAIRAWLFYDVKFNGTKVMLALEADPHSDNLLQDYLENCDAIAMPRLPTPKRTSPQLGFWCTIAMKHLVGLRSRALRPDGLWRDCVRAGGKPYEALATCRGILVRTIWARIKVFSSGMGKTASIHGAMTA